MKYFLFIIVLITSFTIIWAEKFTVQPFTNKIGLIKTKNGGIYPIKITVANDELQAVIEDDFVDVVSYEEFEEILRFIESHKETADEILSQMLPFTTNTNVLIPEYATSLNEQQKDIIASFDKDILVALKKSKNSNHILRN